MLDAFVFGGNISVFWSLYSSYKHGNILSPRCVQKFMLKLKILIYNYLRNSQIMVQTINHGTFILSFLLNELINGIVYVRILDTCCQVLCHSSKISSS